MNGAQTSDPTVRDLHRQVTAGLPHFRYSGQHKGGFANAGEVFRERVNEAEPRVRKRGSPLAAEDDYPIGQALLWYLDAMKYAPRSGRLVARQLALLCRGETEIRVTWRSLADAVGEADKAGRPRAFVERGVQALVEAGWLKVVTIGRGAGASTTFYLMPGDRVEHPEGGDVDVPDELDEPVL